MKAKRQLITGFMALVLASTLWACAITKSPSGGLPAAHQYSHDIHFY